MIKLFTLDTSNKPIEVFKSYHTLENRNEDTAHHRDFNIHKEDYKAILSEAIKKGLISFRNKGVVAIDFKDNEDTKYSILLEVREDFIFIVSVYYNKKDYGIDNFKTVNKRIRLTNYTLDLKADLKETIFITPKLKVKTATSNTSTKKLRKIKKVEKPQKTVNKLEDIELSYKEKQLFLKSVK